MMNPGHSRASQLGLEARARGTLAMDWLMADLDQLAATSLPDSFQQQLKAQLQTVNQLTSEVRQSPDKIAMAASMRQFELSLPAIPGYCGFSQSSG